MRAREGSLARLPVNESVEDILTQTREMRLDGRAHAPLFPQPTDFVERGLQPAHEKRYGL
jgi:hypothetical protein